MLSEVAFKTKLARNLSAPREFNGQVRSMPVVSEAELGTLELVLCDGPSIPDLGVHRAFVAVRALDGRVTTYQFDIPIEKAAEPGAKVISDRPLSGPAD